MKFAGVFLIMISIFIGSCGDEGESSAQTCEISAPSPIFAIREHEDEETIVGQLEAEVGDNSDVTYSIISGNQFNVFGIDATTGTITVKNSADLDFEKIRQFILEVRIASASCRSAMVRVTINVVDIDDSITG